MGGFVLLVGPSGAGKDTLLRLVRERLGGDPRFLFPRRLITRPCDRWEDHDPIDWTAFERGETEGTFALSWRAHGLGYALPGSALAQVRAGGIATCNVSRAKVEEACLRLPVAAVVEVTASPEVLAARIAARGREAGFAARQRALRAAELSCRADVVIRNEGSAAEAAARLVALLEGLAQRAPSEAPVTSRAASRSATASG
ncbi:MAG TPA: phosphonate metabolism protein/1,5-bisphosphokinase (PRPP-forming) PhnN [Beijerinckiaceae bacterium]|jgi:ribose 1,5-bisphosphokinase